MADKCPLCGTCGKLWHKEPAAFMCPNCDSVYSEFGIVIDSQKDAGDFCS
ncbi:MAG: hypothetical protein HY519_00645 [Candidatus Aenigmarchaeota archaeon]|nr:hypothetical protein [Candidatus Aenigmarchaeota archaeon]